MAVRRSGLGKGLDSLIPETVNKTEARTAKKDGDNAANIVKISMVEPNREQPRRNFDEDSLAELTDSIRKNGVLQPLIVQDRKDYYEIIAGERRWRAAKLAGLKEVPVVIKNYSEQEILEISLIENIQREDLNPIEEAAAFKKLLEQFHLKQDEVAERVSKSRTAVTNSMRLLKLDPRVQQMVIDEMLSTGHARALLAIEDGDEQYNAAQRVFDEKMNVREAEKFVKSLKNPPSKSEAEEKPENNAKNPDEELIYRDIEEKLKTALGTKVAIRQKSGGSGRIEIEYFSGDELERILDMLMNIQNN